VIRYGVIGTGMMGWEHLRNLAIVPDAVVTAIADPDPTSRDVGRSAVGADVAVFEDYRDLLRRAPIDAVVIATPNHTHAAVLRDAFATDKHLLVEKPLCTTIDDCHRLIEAGARHRGLLWVGLEYRFVPTVARLIERVREGAVGRLRMIAIREHRFPFLTKVGNWNRFARNTGGTLVEKCCHFFDLMHLLTRQRPLRVFASAAQDVNHLDERYDGETPDIVDNAYAVVEFDGGARGLLDLCMFAEHSVNEMELAATGDAGKAEAFIPAHRLVLTRRDRPAAEEETVAIDPDIRAAGFHHGATYYQHVAFLDAIRRGAPPQVSVHDGALAVAVGLAAERSARQHRPVELRELGF
jgi:myo-inositol 2-dehydrogenase / D-chiro-inositol 1-dehydrogenase